MDKVETILSQYVSGTMFEDLSEAAISSAKRSTIDTIAAMLAGSTAPGIETIVQMSNNWGGKPEAHLIGFGHKLPAPLAAWCNASMARAMEIDDVVDFLPLHPSASAVPALLALCESRGNVSGKDFLTALAVGQDLVIRIGLAVRLNAMQSGRYNMFKIFAPAAAVARALELNPDQTRHTLGIAFSYAAGDGQSALDGALSLRLHQGIVAQGALLSGLLAEQGFTGARDFLMGPFGYLVAFEPDPRLEYLTKGLGQEFLGERISIKPFSSCRCTHSPIDLALSLMKQHKLEPSSVNTIKVEVSPEAYQLVAHPHEFRARPDSAVTAQFSIQYTVAAAIMRDDMFLKELEADSLTDEKILTLAERVHVNPDESLRTETAIGRTIITIVRSDGVEFKAEIEAPLGSPERPMSLDACADKLMKCSAYAVRQIKEESLQKLIDQVAHLEEMDDVSQLIVELS